MSMLSLFGRSAMQSALDKFKELSNDINSSINDFELDKFDTMFEDVNKSFEKSMTRLNKSVNRLKKRVKNTDTELVINIPYNRNTDTLSTTIEDNQFKAVVKSEDGTTTRETNIFIDDDVDVDSVTRKYDEERNVMYFTFKKF